MDDVKRDNPADITPDGSPQDETRTPDGAAANGDLPTAVEAATNGDEKHDAILAASQVVAEPSAELDTATASETTPSANGKDGNDGASSSVEAAPLIATPITGRPVRHDIQPTAPAATDTIPLAPEATDTIPLAPEATQEATAAPDTTPGAITLAEPPANTEEIQPTEEPQVVVQRQPIWKTVVSVIVGSRWVLAIPALAAALYAGRLVEDARTSPISRPPVPPDQSWQLFALAAALLVVAVWPRKLPTTEGLRAYLSKLRHRNGETWLDFSLLVLFAAIGAAGIVFIAARGVKINDYEVLNWAIVTWLWPFLSVSTSNLNPTVTLVLSWLVLFAIFLFTGILATFIPGLRSSGPSVFLRELTRIPDPAPKQSPAPAEAASAPEASEAVQAAQTAEPEIAQASESVLAADVPAEPDAVIPVQPVVATQQTEQTEPSTEDAITPVSIAAPVTEGTEPVAPIADNGKPAKDKAATNRARRVVWRRILLFFVPLALSLACVGAAIPLFIELNRSGDPAAVAQNWWVNNGSWLLWIAAMLLFGLAFLAWERTTRPPAVGENPNPPGDRFPLWLELVVMLGLFGVALFFRLKDLQTVPAGFWFDEGQDGLVSRQLVTPGAGHPTFIGDFTQMGSLLWYIMGVLIKIFGNGILPVRIIPALMGSLIAPMLYLLGARLYGWRVGLAAGGLVAILDWNITWSRIGTATMPTIAIIVIVYLCLTQALRTGRLGYYAASGILLGLALHMYYASKLVPFIIGGILLARLVTERMKPIRAVRVGAIVFVVGALIAFTPVALFAIQRPSDYNARTDIVSVFSTMNSPTIDSLKVNLESNVRRHALMFNWEGDGNGRHNLPGTPMLDWITAALFFSGLASCALRFWRWQYLFPVVWTMAGLSGGVFSLPFEAPQGHRTLEMTVVTTLIAGIFIGEVWTAVLGPAQVARLVTFGSWIFNFGKRITKRAPRVQIQNPKSKIQNLAWPMRVGWVVGAATLLYVVWQAGILNTHKYFDVQAQDLSVVKDMQAPQAEAVRQTLLYGDEYNVFVTPIWQGIPQAQYLAPDVQTISWPGLHALPLSPDRPGGAVIILDLPSAADISMIARMYPHASFEIYSTTSNPEPLVLTIKIPDSDIRANRGVMTTFYENGSSKPGAQKLLPDFTYDWNGPGAKPGTVRFSTTVKVEQFTTYTFNLKSGSGNDSAGQVMVDGYELKAGDPISLALGLHSIVATDTVSTPAGVTQLLWAPTGNQPQAIPALDLFDPTKIEPHGLTGIYRPGTDFNATPILGRVDPVISYYFHLTPVQLPFTTVWEGALYAPEDGQYTLSTEQLSSSELWVDGVEKINNTSINNLIPTSLQLTRGFHDIRLQYLDAGSASHMYLYWAPPGRPQTIIPSIFLWPKMGSYPDKPESGDWPTLDISDGSQIPQNRITYNPPRPTQPQPAQQHQSTGQQQPPVDTAQQPQSPGKTLEPLFTVGDNSAVPGRPKSAASDKDGNLYIFTERDSMLHKYDPKGKAISTWSVKNSSGPLTEGSGVVVRGDRLYVLDSSTSDLIAFTLDGKPADNIHLCTCFFPRDIRLSNDNNFWVSNTGNGQVFKVGPTGEQITALGAKGDQPGQFNEPAGVWEAPDGTVFVADISNHRVQSFTPDLKPIAQWDVGQSIARDGDRITGDSQGNVLVTETESHGIVMYDKNGKELHRWVLRRNGAEYMPAGITALGDDKFLVLFPENDTAAVFTTVEK